MNARTVWLLAVVLALGSCSCGGSGARTSSINERAALNGTMPWNPLQWKVITSSIDRQTSTMSTLYGDEVAVRYARGNSQQDYPAGSVLALVTWTQQEDFHWFGARIPAQVKSVEFVIVTADPNRPRSYSYQTYEGSPLQQRSVFVGPSPGSRAAYLLSLRAAVMP